MRGTVDRRQIAEEPCNTWIFPKLDSSISFLFLEKLRVCGTATQSRFCATYVQICGTFCSILLETWDLDVRRKVGYTKTFSMMYHISMGAKLF
jgi:hypothetical protein